MTASSIATPAAPRQLHPLFHAGRFLLEDLVATLAFVGLYAIFHSIYLATFMAIGLGIAQIAYTRARRRKVDVMQWLSLFLVVVFGGASLLLRDPRFIMVKPTLIYTAVALVMCKPGWMLRYMPPIAVARAGDVITVFGYLWAALIFATGVANAVLAIYASHETWAWFIGVVPLTSKFLMFGVQYVVTRAIVRRRVMAEGGLVAASA